MAPTAPDPTAGTAAAVELCERVLTVLGGRAEAVVSSEVGASALTRFANGHIHQNTSEERRGVRLTVAVDGRVARATTTRTDHDGLSALVDRALAAAALRPADPDFAGFAPPAAVAPVEHWDEGTAAATPDDRSEIVAAFVGARGAVAGVVGGPRDVAPIGRTGAAGAAGATGAGGHEEGAADQVDAAGYCSTRAVAHALVSTTGQRAVARSTAAEVDGIHRARGRTGEPADGCAQATAVRLSDIDGAACGARAAAKAWSGLDPIELPPGEYEVVLEPRAVAAALLFPAVMGFNGKAHAEGTSFVRLGEAQWDAAVDIWDDATDPRALGDPYDVEGTPKRRYELVRAGMATAVTHDRRSARLAGVEPTGHSVGSDAFGGVATDLFVGGGDRTPEELVGDVERGLLVTDLWYNRILDPKTQVVTGLTRNGLFLVEDGRVTRPVRNMRFTQSIVAGFGPNRVRGLGDDARLVGTEGGPRMHVPSVRLAAWSFTGNARG